MKNEMMSVNTKVGDEYIILAENIRTVREAMHLSRSQFANHCHVSKETIESIEHLAKNNVVKHPRSYCSCMWYRCRYVTDQATTFTYSGKGIKFYII